MKKLLPLLATSLSLCAVTTACGKKKSDFKLDPKHEVIFDKYAKCLEQTKSDYYSFLETWYKDETEVNGMNFWEEIERKVKNEEDFTVESFDENFIIQSKNTVYFAFLYTEFLFNYESTNTDELRCLLDHYMSFKDSYLYLLSEAGGLVPFTKEVGVYSENAFYIYSEIKTTVEETYEKEFKDTIVDFRDYLNDVFHYVPTQATIYEPVIDKFISLVQFNEEKASHVTTWLNDYLDTSKPGHGGNSYETILGFSDEEAWSFDTDEKIENAYQTSFNSILFFVDTIVNMIQNSPKEYLATPFFLNNIAPICYKILDLVEAYRDDDKANVSIMAAELVGNTLTFDSFYKDDIA